MSDYSITVQVIPAVGNYFTGLVPRRLPSIFKYTSGSEAFGTAVAAGVAAVSGIVGAAAAAAAADILVAVDIDLVPPAEMNGKDFVVLA